MIFGLDILAQYNFILEAILAFCCAIYVLLTRHDVYGRQQRRLFAIVSLYLLFYCFSFVGAATYRLSPAVYVSLAPLMLLSLIIVPVFFYRIVWGLTNTEEKKRFCFVHYIVPVVLTLVWSVTTSFLPFGVRVAIIENLGAAASGYEDISAYYTSVSVQMLIFQLVYLLFTLARYLYYKKLNDGNHCEDAQHRLRWVGLLIGLSIIKVVAPLVMLLSETRATYFNAAFSFISTGASAVLHLILTFNILRRNYPPRRSGTSKERRPAVPGFFRDIAVPDYRATETPATPIRQREQPSTAGRNRNAVLSRRRLDAHFRSKKPYLDPHITLEGLAAELGTGRTKLSNFINAEYGMNFNGFVNHWRLHELDRLSALANNEGKPVVKLLPKVGFGSYDAYLRAKKLIAREKGGGR